MSRPTAFEITTRRPVTILMIVIAVCVFGFVSYQKLPLTLMPDIAYPTITVRTEYPGTAPQEVETQISQPLEQQLAIVSKLERINSISRAEQSDIVMEFSWGSDMSEIAQEIREKLDRVRLPEEAKRPIILRYDPTLDPIMRIGLTSSQRPQDELRVLIEDVLQRDLEGEEGIAAVTVKGGLEEEYQVNIDEHKLVSLNLNIQQVNTKLTQNNVNVPGGQLDEGETRYLIRTLNEFQSIDDIANIAIARKGGVDIRLRDFASVEKSHQEREIITRVNGVESIEVEIYKEADANIVEVARMVRNRLFGLPAQQAYVKKQLAKKEQPEEKTETDSDKKKTPGNDFQNRREQLKMTDFIQSKLPGDISLEVLTDQSLFIKASIDEVKNNAIVGGLIAVAVIFLFLRKVGHTVIIGITIPVSIVATFAPMYMAGLSLNIISLGGLALGIGMLVDNSIVVLESIFRCREEGDDLKTSTLRGVSEVGGAVFASTLTTIAVFFPIVFVEGVAGQVFGNMALTVVFSLMASLLVALYFIPMLASRNFGTGKSDPSSKSSYFNAKFIKEPWHSFKNRWNSFQGRFKPNGKRSKTWIPIAILPFGALTIIILLIELVLRIIGKFLETVIVILIAIAFIGSWIGMRLLGLAKPILILSEQSMKAATHVYSSFLDYSLQARGFVLAIAFALFGFCIYAIYPLIGNELIPETRQGEFYINAKMPAGTAIERTALAMREVENEIKENPSVERFATVVGSEKGATADADEGEHTSKITVVLKNGSTAEQEEAVVTSIRELASRLPDMKLEIDYPVLFSSKAPIEVQLYGYDIDRMKSLSSQVATAMGAVPGIVDVQSYLQPGSPEIQINYDRKRIVQLGLQLRPIAELVRNKVQGMVPTTFRERDRQIDIRVRLEEDDRYGLDDLKKLVINPNSPSPIPLSAIANFVVREGANEVRHIDQQRGTIISANVGDVDLSEATNRIDAALQQIEFPLAYSYDIAGQHEEMERSTTSMLFALALALFLVYIVMASQFESLVHPFIILFTVPLALIGVLLTLYFGGWSLNILVFIGLIMLAGIVVNNAIVLVDYINKLRREKGIEKMDAIRTACLVRFRPILMTTLTTVLGVAPMALGIGEGAEIRVPLAITLISGLSSSTLLTLVVIPCAYAIIDRETVKTKTKETLSLDTDNPQAAPTI